MSFEDIMDDYGRTTLTFLGTAAVAGALYFGLGSNRSSSIDEVVNNTKTTQQIAYEEKIEAKRDAQEKARLAAIEKRANDRKAEIAARNEKRDNERSARDFKRAQEKQAQDELNKKLQFENGIKSAVNNIKLESQRDNQEIMQSYNRTVSDLKNQYSRAVSQENKDFQTAMRSYDRAIRKAETNISRKERENRSSSRRQAGNISGIIKNTAGLYVMKNRGNIRQNRRAASTAGNLANYIAKTSNNVYNANMNKAQIARNSNNIGDLNQDKTDYVNQFRARMKALETNYKLDLQDANDKKDDALGLEKTELTEALNSIETDIKTFHDTGDNTALRTQLMMYNNQSKSSRGKGYSSRIRNAPVTHYSGRGRTARTR